MKTASITSLFATCFACAALTAGAAPIAPPTPDSGRPADLLSSAQAVTGQIDLSLLNEARLAKTRGFNWLAKRQRPDGSWSSPDMPAITALGLWAFAISDYSDKAQVVSNAVQFILKHAQPDGSIYKKSDGPGGGLVNYNTALCMTALHMTGDPALTPVVLKARKFMAGAQRLEGNDMYRGGFGYDQAGGRKYTDLSDSVIAYEAMRLTQGAEDMRPAGEKRVDVNWQAATQFLGHVQNTEKAGPEDAGGFAYKPDESKAGMVTNKEGAVVLRSYGSMTYAGLLSLIYADVSKDDPRVRSAFDWAVNHWSLDANPGMGEQGLYYFYNIMSKALASFGREAIPVKNGPPVSWRSQMVNKLIKLQKTEPDGSGEGYWVNANNRWMETDHALVTAYTLIALQIAEGGSK